MGTSGSDVKSLGIIQWAMMIFGFVLVAGVVFREAMLMLAGDTTTVTHNWPILAIGAIFFIGGLSCWFCPKNDKSNTSESDKDDIDI